MCRNIRRLFNVEPAATQAEVRDAALQFVRKVSGYREPSAANEEAFEHAVNEISQSGQKLLDSLTTNAPPQDREAEAAKRRERANKRYSA